MQGLQAKKGTCKQTPPGEGGNANRPDQRYLDSSQPFAGILMNPLSLTATSYCYYIHAVQALTE